MVSLRLVVVPAVPFPDPDRFRNDPDRGHVLSPPKKSNGGGDSGSGVARAGDRGGEFASVCGGGEFASVCLPTTRGDCFPDRTLDPPGLHLCRAFPGLVPPVPRLNVSFEGESFTSVVSSASIGEPGACEKVNPKPSPALHGTVSPSSSLSSLER